MQIAKILTLFLKLEVRKRPIRGPIRGRFYDRQVEPMVTEWQWHNTFYSVANALGRIGFANRFGSVDLDEYPGCNWGFGTQITVTGYYYVKAWWKGMKDN